MLFSEMQRWATLFSEMQRWAPLYSEIQRWATLFSEMQRWAMLFSEIQRWARFILKCKGGHPPFSRLSCLYLPLSYLAFQNNHNYAEGTASVYDLLVRFIKELRDLLFFYFMNLTDLGS